MKYSSIAIKNIQVLPCCRVAIFLPPSHPPSFPPRHRPEILASEILRGSRLSSSPKSILDASHRFFHFPHPWLLPWLPPSLPMRILKDPEKSWSRTWNRLESVNRKQKEAPGSILTGSSMIEPGKYGKLATTPAGSPSAILETSLESANQRSILMAASAREGRGKLRPCPWKGAPRRDPSSGIRSWRTSPEPQMPVDDVIRAVARVINDCLLLEPVSKEVERTRRIGFLFFFFFPPSFFFTSSWLKISSRIPPASSPASSPVSLSWK